MPLCLIGLGSNLGDKETSVKKAIDLLSNHQRIQLINISNAFSTKPVGGPDGQGDFVNAALTIETDLPIPELVQFLLSTEKELGREREIRWEARKLDLDLLLYGDEINNQPECVVPHPRMSYRRFVLEPACEIASEMVHPIVGLRLSQLLQRINQRPKLIKIYGARAKCDELLDRLAREDGLTIATSNEDLKALFESSSMDPSEVFVQCLAEKPDQTFSGALDWWVLDEDEPDLIHGRLRGFYPHAGPYLVTNANDHENGMIEFRAAIEAMS